MATVQEVLPSFRKKNDNIVNQATQILPIIPLMGL